MAGRVYRVPFNALGLGTAVEDLWALTTGSAQPCLVEEIRLDPCATSVSEFSLSINLYTGSFTAGSSGTTATIAKSSQGDAAAISTCKVKNTGQTVVGSGTKAVLDAAQWNLVNGYYWQPLDPDHRIMVPVSACLVVSLDTAPASQTVSGCLIFREMY